MGWLDGKVVVGWPLMAAATLTLLTLWPSPSTSQGLLSQAIDTDEVDGVLGARYSGTINSTVRMLYRFTAAAAEIRDSAFRVHTASSNAVSAFPLMIVASQNKGVLSWELPVSFEDDDGRNELTDDWTRRTEGVARAGAPYRYSNRTLCPPVPASGGKNEHQEERQQEVLVSLSTASLDPVAYELEVYLQTNLSLTLDQNSLNTTLVATASPTAPVYFRFLFPDNGPPPADDNPFNKDEVVQLEFRSPDQVCATVSIQDLTCPVHDLQKDVHYRGLYQTLNTMSGATVSRSLFPNGFYLVLVVSPDDSSCVEEIPWRGFFSKPSRSPFDGEGQQQVRRRVKELRISVSGWISTEEYLVAVLVAVLAFLGVYLIVMLVSCFMFFSEYRTDPENLRRAAASCHGGAAMGGGAASSSPLQPPAERPMSPQARRDELGSADPDEIRVVVVENGLDAADTGADGSVGSSQVDDDSLPIVDASTASSSAGISGIKLAMGRGALLSSMADQVKGVGRYWMAKGPYDIDNNHAGGRLRALVYEDDDLSACDAGEDRTDLAAASAPAAPSVYLTMLRDPDPAALMLDEFDLLEDADTEKIVYRTKPETSLKVTDLCRAPGGTAHHRLKSDQFKWISTTIAVFYALPVIQLVLTFQKVTLTFGNMDMCYFNFLCSNPWLGLTSFNAVVSNLGYVMLGFLFIVCVRGKQNRHRRLTARLNDPNLTTAQLDNEAAGPATSNPDTLAGDPGVTFPGPSRPLLNLMATTGPLGLPPRFGIHYAMGVCLIAEGVLSACYHVCPNQTNFQFDTAFMYSIALLILVNLYYARHVDVSLQAYKMFGILAAVIFVSVLGVLRNTAAAWLLFTICHLGLYTVLSLHIYYAGTVSFNPGLFRRAYHLAKNDFLAGRTDATARGTGFRRVRSCSSVLRPAYPYRFGWLLVANAVNWTLDMMGLAFFFTTGQNLILYFVLAIFSSNVVIYCFYYIVSKFRAGERLSTSCAIYLASALLMAGPAIYFFRKTSYSKTGTAAESKHLNHACVLLNFYDTHDVWHFLSALALFLSFMTLLTLDDDLTFVPRSQIRVF